MDSVPRDGSMFRSFNIENAEEQKGSKTLHFPQGPERKANCDVKVESQMGTWTGKGLPVGPDSRRKNYTEKVRDCIAKLLRDYKGSGRS